MFTVALAVGLRQGEALGLRWQDVDLDAGLVFTTLRGTAVDARNVVRWFHAIREAANLDHFRMHDLRHSCASHSSITMTADVYTHVMPGLKRDAADRMDAALGTG